MDLSKLTILFCTCDSYEDAWEPFFKLFAKFWPDCNLDIVFNTESKEYSYPGLKIKCYKKYFDKSVPYGERMIAHIKEIKTPYTLLLMDDFFLRDRADLDELSDVIRFMDNDADAVRFSFQALTEDKFVDSMGYGKYGLVRNYEDYKYNFQAAIWRTDYLLSSWKRHESPRDWEIIGNYRSFDETKKFYALKDKVNNPINYGYVYGSPWGIWRGKWVPETVDDIFKENGIAVDYGVRGIFHEEENNLHFVKSKRDNELTMLKSWGVGLYLKVLMWRIGHFVGSKLGFNTSAGYAEYMRNRRRIF